MNLRDQVLKLAQQNPGMAKALKSILIKTAQSKHVPLPGIIRGYQQDTQEFTMIGPEVDAKTWARTMDKALASFGGGYNEFDAAAVGSWAVRLEQKYEGLKFSPGREYSVVLYISGPTSALVEIARSAKRMRADEVGLTNLRSSSGRNIPIQPIMSKLKSGDPDVPQTGLYLRLWWD